MLRSYTVLRCAGLFMFGVVNVFEGVFFGSKDVLMFMIGWFVVGVIIVVL